MPYALTTNQEGAFESCLPINCQYIIAGSKGGYQNNDLLLTVNNTSILSKTIALAAIDKKPISYTIPVPESIQSGDVVEIPSLRYDLEIGRILSTENGVLHQLISLLQRHPKMTIEVVEHTDARGSAYYNFELSQARATIVKNHIMQQGNINSKRIKAIGMGEQQLKNHCNGVVPCSNEEHQANKRTEIRIVSMGKAVVKSY